VCFPASGRREYDLDFSLEKLGQSTAIDMVNGGGQRREDRWLETLDLLIFQDLPAKGVCSARCPRQAEGQVRKNSGIIEDGLRNA
jgi:hypothetical protein